MYRITSWVWRFRSFKWQRNIAAKGAKVFVRSINFVFYLFLSEEQAAGRAFGKSISYLTSALLFGPVGYWRLVSSALVAFY